MAGQPVTAKELALLSRAPAQPDAAAASAPPAAGAAATAAAPSQQDRAAARRVASLEFLGTMQAAAQAMLAAADPSSEEEPAAASAAAPPPPPAETGTMEDASAAAETAMQAHATAGATAAEGAALRLSPWQTFAEAAMQAQAQAQQQQPFMRLLLQVLQQHEQQRAAAAAGGWLRPAGLPPWLLESLRCPITMATLRDPVFLLESGHTFERAAIAAWLTRNATCPLTKRPLASLALAPNFALRALLSDAGLPVAPLSEATSAAVEPPPVLQPPDMMLLVFGEEDHEAAEEEEEEEYPTFTFGTAQPLEPPAPALLPEAEMEGLWSDMDSAWAIEQAYVIFDLNGGAAGVVRLLSSADAGAVRQAAWCLRALTASNEVDDIVAGTAAVERLAALLGHAEPGVVAQAAGALAELAGRSAELAASVAGANCCLLSLSALLAAADGDVVLQAARALARLARDDRIDGDSEDDDTAAPSLRVMVAPGAIRGLTALLSHTAPPGVAAEAASALGFLAGADAASMCDAPGLLAALATQLTERGEPDAAERAAWVLAQLTADGDPGRGARVGSGHPLILPHLTALLTDPPPGRDARATVASALAGIAASPDRARALAATASALEVLRALASCRRPAAAAAAAKALSRIAAAGPARPRSTASSTAKSRRMD